MPITSLCVGPRNSGKTMLMTSIQYPESVNFTSHSVNTVGTNIYTIAPPLTEPKPSRKNAKKMIRVRELGGEMAVMWKQYYMETIDRIIFVVDTSNLCQISCAGIELLIITVNNNKLFISPFGLFFQASCCIQFWSSRDSRKRKYAWC